jgi:hypothetical protein
MNPSSEEKWSYTTVTANGQEYIHKYVIVGGMYIFYLHLPQLMGEGCEENVCMGSMIPNVKPSQ